jgi:hypothetical protein
MPHRRDSGYYWWRRVRIQVPVLTDPAVIFECGDHRAHLRAGDSWYFDNWQTHALMNGCESPCIHLMADIKVPPGLRRWFEAPGANAHPRTDHPQAPQVEPYCFEVLTPAEFTNLADQIREGAHASAQQTVNAALTAASAGWQEVFLRSGHSAHAEAQYFLVIDRLRRELADVEFAGPAQRALQIILTVLRTNEGFMRHGVRRTVLTPPDASWNAEATYRTPDDRTPVLSSRIATVLKAFQEPRTVAAAHEISAAVGTSARAMSREEFTAAACNLHGIGLLEEDLAETVVAQPVFIVSAPRSGSTMLFDALSRSDDLWTTGHENHALIERDTGLGPEDREWASNRLTGADCSAALRSLLTERYVRELRNVHGVFLRSIPSAERRTCFRLLDKTPKNALRIPFLNCLFPGARFVYLYRDPAPNVSSMIEGWRSGRFVTYPRLPGWPYWPWSFLLPPEWRQLRGSPPAEIAAFQWSSANAQIISDLAALPPGSWIAVSYDSLVRNPRPVLQKLFGFLNCPWGKIPEEYTESPLPLSPATLGVPHSDKWLRHEQVIRPLLPDLMALFADAQELEAKNSTLDGGNLSVHVRRRPSCYSDEPR